MSGLYRLSKFSIKIFMGKQTILLGSKFVIKLFLRKTKKKLKTADSGADRNLARSSAI
jgi:hypothetical protein